MSGADPAGQAFWLASRATGIVALALLALSVSLGLALAGRLASRPGLPARVRRLHEACTLVALGLIATHGGLLLGDAWLDPGPAGILLPFRMDYRPAWTGLGIVAGWLAALLVLSFYVRRRIGVRTWRWLHRWTLAVYALAVAHAIGAGTDGRTTWMLAMLALLSAPVVFALTYRALPRPQLSAEAARARRVPRQSSVPIGTTETSTIPTRMSSMLARTKSTWPRK